MTRLSIAVRLTLVAAGTAIASALLWLSVTVHLQRACAVMDTPYLPLCTSTERQTDAERASSLRQYLSRNPGDSAAWIQLAHLEKGQYAPALFRAAATLAPTEPNVLMWRAGEALARKDFPQATDLLVQLVRFWNRGEAVQVLARIMASGEGIGLLRKHLATSSQWLPPVLATMTALKLPIASALPLVAEGAANGSLPQPILRMYIRSLKGEGNWGDAYALWLAQQKGPKPLLNNGGFDEGFQADGFDWEVTPSIPSRAGAVVTQRGMAKRGQVLEVQFTGREVAMPVIRQYVFAAPGKYLFSGQYMTSRLRMEEGLAWTARCTNKANSLAGSSEGLQDTAGRWQELQFTLVIPVDCGQVFSLQLDTHAAFEAAAGFKGTAFFDSFALKATGL